MEGVISLSSGEAELYAATRAAACGIQLQRFLTEIGCPLPLCVHSDSAAARGMMTRRGSGRVKPRYQSTMVSGNNRKGRRYRLMKVGSENNPADVGTKTRVQTESFISYDGWERTLCWVTVESNEDDTKKGSERSRCEFKVVVTAPWTQERGRPEKTGQVELRSLQFELQVDSCGLTSNAVPKRTLICVSRVPGAVEFCI